MLCQAMRLTQSEYEKITRVYDILVDFQTGGNFPVLVGYIYKFVTKCDGAQTQASVFYIPTLVALSGPSALICQDVSRVYTSGLGSWEVSLAGSSTCCRS